MKKDKIKSPRRLSRKVDRAFGGQLIYDQVLRGISDAGFTPKAMEKLTLTAARAETHDKILFGDGRDGLVSDVEHLKLNTQATLTSINLTLTELKSQLGPLIEWKSGIVVKVAVIIVGASTVSAVLGAMFTLIIKWKPLLESFLKASE